MEQVQIGIIGGSGLYDMADVTDRKEVTLSTPFGEPSGPYLLGTLRGKRVAFLARHGAGHRISPSELNFRANIFGMKLLGVEYILSASAVGSLKEEYKPLDIVIPDQFIDRTRGRVSTFFGRGLVAHVGFAHPFCRILSGVVHASGTTAGATVHRGGTYVCMEGPQFSTLAESKLYRSWGDGHHRHDQPAGGEARAGGGDLLHDDRARHRLRLLASRPRFRHRGDGDRATSLQNAKTAQQMIAGAVEHLPFERTCECATALKYALITRPDVDPRADQEGTGPARRQIPAGHLTLHEAHRHRIDSVRLPDVVSREVHRALSRRAHAAGEPQLPRGHDGQAARRLRAEHRVHPGAARRASVSDGHRRPGFPGVWRMVEGGGRRHVAGQAGARQVHGIVLLQHGYREQPDRVVLYRRHGERGRAVVPDHPGSGAGHHLAQRSGARWCSMRRSAARCASRTSSTTASRWRACRATSCATGSAAPTSSSATTTSSS